MVYDFDETYTGPKYDCAASIQRMEGFLVESGCELFTEIPTTPNSRGVVYKIDDIEVAMFYNSQLNTLQVVVNGLSHGKSRTVLELEAGIQDLLVKND